MAWTDAARAASIAARHANAQTAQKGAHSVGVATLGQKQVSDKVLAMIQNTPPDGGFSVRPTGETPSKGYMVSESGRSRVLQPGDLKGPSAKDIINDYYRKNADVLDKPGGHIGGWVDPATGLMHLDVSHNIASRNAAVKAGKLNNQIGIYDVKHQRTINTGGTGDKH